MVNDGQSNSNQTLITTVAIVFLAGFVIGGVVGYLLGRQASYNVKLTVETPALDKVLSEMPPLSEMPERIDGAKWSEGKAMMGSIATAIRAYHAERGPTGSEPTTLYVSETGIGFERGDLTGTYFGDEDFSFEVTSMNPLKFTITCVAGKSGIPAAPSSPSAYILNQDGIFIPK